jgi:hypothetical protein
MTGFIDVAFTWRMPQGRVPAAMEKSLFFNAFAEYSGTGPAGQR